jgi:hypothetical protein
MGDGVKCVCNPTSSRDFRVPMTPANEANY